MATELEIYRTYEEFPNDSSNKTAISLNYYFPSSYGDYYIIKEDDAIWYDCFGNMLVTSPINEWGVENYDYYFMYEDFKNIKTIFMDRGFPVIIGEAGILTKNSNANLFIQFLYVLFSMSSEYDGIMAYLWDNPENNEENKFYYNRETNKWTNEKIKKVYKKFQEEILLKH